MDTWNGLLCLFEVLLAYDDVNILINEISSTGGGVSIANVITTNLRQFSYRVGSPNNDILSNIDTFKINTQ